MFAVPLGSLPVCRGEHRKGDSEAWEELLWVDAQRHESAERRVGSLLVESEHAGAQQRLFVGQLTEDTGYGVADSRKVARGQLGIQIPEDGLGHKPTIVALPVVRRSVSARHVLTPVSSPAPERLSQTSYVCSIILTCSYYCK